jgi:hypothetical protein
MADQVPDAPARSPSISERIRRVMTLSLIDVSDEDINGMSIDELRTLCMMNNIIPGQKGIPTLRRKLLALRSDHQEERRRQMLAQTPNPTQQDSTSPQQDRPPSLPSHEADPPPNDENEAAESSSNENNAAPVVETVDEASQEDDGDVFPPPEDPRGAHHGNTEAAASVPDDKANLTGAPDDDSYNSEFTFGRDISRDAGAFNLAGVNISGFASAQVLTRDEFLSILDTRNETQNVQFERSIEACYDLQDNLKRDFKMQVDDLKEKMDEKINTLINAMSNQTDAPSNSLLERQLQLQEEQLKLDRIKEDRLARQEAQDRADRMATEARDQEARRQAVLQAERDEANRQAALQAERHEANRQAALQAERDEANRQAALQVERDEARSHADQQDGTRRHLQFDGTTEMQNDGVPPTIPEEDDDEILDEAQRSHPMYDPEPPVPQQPPIPNQTPSRTAWRGHNINVTSSSSSPLKTPEDERFVSGGASAPFAPNIPPQSSHWTGSQSSKGNLAEQTRRVTHFSSSMVTSPYSSKLLRGNSPFNSPQGLHYRTYLCGRDGISDPKEFSEQFLLELGFGLDMHEEVRQGTFFILDYFGNPAVNLKYIGNFHKLEDLKPETFLEWYAFISADMQTSNIALVPFDAIVPKYAYVGLCFPGIGEERYLKMAKGFFTVLEHTLPKDNLVVRECMKAYAGSNHDGFRLLDSIMARTLPVFCSEIPCTPPTWMEYPDVPTIANQWLVYFRFSAKEGTFYSPLKRSTMFVKSIQEHSLVGLVSSYRGQLNQFANSINEFDEPFIAVPDHLTIQRIASAMMTSISPLDTSITFASSSSTLALSPMSHHTRVPDIQGVNAQLNATTRQPTNRAPANQRGGRRAAAPRPRRTSNSGVWCRACHRKNHEEVDCRELGRWLIFNNHHRSLSRDLQRRVIDNYNRYYDSSLPSPSAAMSAARQLEDFCTDRHTSPAEVTQLYDWEAYANYCVQEDEGFASAQEEDEDASE